MNQQYENIFLRPKQLTFSFSGTSTSGQKLKHWVILLLNILKRRIYSVSIIKANCASHEKSLYEFHIKLHVKFTWNSCELCVKWNLCEIVYMIFTQL